MTDLECKLWELVIVLAMPMFFGVLMGWLAGDDDDPQGTNTLPPVPDGKQVQ